MEEITFEYQTRNGVKTYVDRELVDIDTFQSDWINKIQNKYKEFIISPRVVVVVSENGRSIHDSHLLADGLLN